MSSESSGSSGDGQTDPSAEREAPRHTDADGATRFNWSLTSRQASDPVVLYMPPNRVVPVVFVPGIMGSNLRATKDVYLADRNGTTKDVKPVAQKGERVWNVDSTTSPIWADNSTGWFGASPAKRQLCLNKDVVEVDDRGKIELRRDEYFVCTPQAGRAGDRQRQQVRQARMDDKRRRGWGTVSWYSYGPFLNWLEEELAGATYRNGRPSTTFLRLLKRAGTTPAGAESAPSPLTEDQIKQLASFRFPVHAVGYNWLKSNVDSGLALANKIQEIRNEYERQGLTCEKVIVITHSMGGLVARAASQLHGADKNILAVIHGVMPTNGAAVFYKRFVGGFAEEGEGIAGRVIGDITAMVLGPDARHTTPVLGLGPGPMELAPNRQYNGGRPWLLIQDANGRLIKRLPERGDPYEEIYHTSAWWQAVNPEWLNPAELRINVLAFHRRALHDAEDYHEQLWNKFHSPTYAYYGSDSERHTWGTITWRAVVASYYEARPQDTLSSKLPPPRRLWSEHPNEPLFGRPEQWTARRGRKDVPPNEGQPERHVHDRAGQPLRCVIQPPSDPGDGTVPAAEGAAGLRRASPAVLCRTAGYDHQGSYNDDTVRAFVLDSVVRAIVPLKVST